MRMCFLYNASDGCNTPPSLPNNAASVNPFFTSRRLIRRLSTLAKSGPLKRTISISIRSTVRSSMSDISRISGDL
ncbi:hypothetical protein D3C87_1739320 [compost metagenome]